MEVFVIGISFLCDIFGVPVASVYSFLGPISGKGLEEIKRLEDVISFEEKLTVV